MASFSSPVAEICGMKSQRPRRRKQELQVARPGMWPVSACQPNMARRRASRFMGGEGGERVGEGGLEEGTVAVDGVGVGFGGWTIVVISGWYSERSKKGGVERLVGRSAAIASRDSYRWRRLEMALVW